LGDGKGIQPEKVGCWFVGDDDFTGALQVVTTTSIIFSCSKTQNGDILVPAYPGCSGKWPLKECCRVDNNYTYYLPSTELEKLTK